MIKGKQQQLLGWRKRPFLDKMLDDGVSPKWCKENDFDVSVPTVYAYAKKRKEAIIQGIKMNKALPAQKNEKRLANNQTNKERKLSMPL